MGAKRPQLTRTSHDPRHSDGAGTFAGTPIIPTLEEAADLVPREGGPVWTYANDIRSAAGGGAPYALMLQVSHPVVGAGVAEHSNFRADPWSRLLRTLDFLTCTTFGEPRLAHETCSRVREMHKQIKGTLPNGENYHALEPEPYAWVHATLADAIIRGNEHFIRRIPERDLEPFWAEWRRMGRLLGVRERDLPERWSEFSDYLDWMVSERLERTQSVDDVLASLEKPPSPPVRGVVDPLWKAARLPARRGARIGLVGLMPPALRRKLGLPWKRGNDLEFRAMAVAMRAAGPLRPKSATEFGRHYLRWRRDAITRGEVGFGRRHQVRSGCRLMASASLLERALGAAAAAPPPDDRMSERILDAARELVAASGLHKVTMDDVAAKAGVGG